MKQRTARNATGLRSALGALARDERGATAIEYALILAAIAAVVTIVVISLGGKVKQLYTTTDANFPT